MVCSNIILISGFMKIHQFVQEIQGHSDTVSLYFLIKLGKCDEFYSIVTCLQYRTDPVKLHEYYLLAEFPITYAFIAASRFNDPYPACV